MDHGAICFARSEAPPLLTAIASLAVTVFASFALELALELGYGLELALEYPQLGA